MERSLDPNRVVYEADGVFGTWDYVLFGIMLSISCVIGLFLAWKDSRSETEQTTNQYLLGGRSMRYYRDIPVHVVESYMSYLAQFRWRFH